MNNRNISASRMIPLGSFALALYLLLALSGSHFAVLAQDDEPAQQVPLYEQEPYDLITLTSDYKSEVIKVEPLDLPGRRLPINPRRSQKLQVRLWEDPETVYELRWGAINKIDLFEQLVLKKAVQLTREGKSEDAYGYFAYLQRNDPKLPGLATAFEEYLSSEAVRLQNKRQYRAALAVLNELYRRNRDYPDLQTNLAAVSEKIIEQYVADENYAAARAIIAALEKRLPRHDMIAKWNTRIKGEAEALLTESRLAFQAGDFRRADQTGHQIAAIWPNLPGANELIAEINHRYPRVVVGVGMPLNANRLTEQPGRFGGIHDDWATRRDRRLLYRTLTEYLGPGAGGGIYRCGVGEMEITDLEQRITFRIHPGIRWWKAVVARPTPLPPQEAGELTGNAVAHRLLVMADASEKCYSRCWSSLLGKIEVNHVYRVDIDLSRPHVRPDALLQTVLPPYTTDRLQTAKLNLCNGPYRIVSQDEHDTVYILNKNYFAAEDGQPKEIVERGFDDERTAVEALRDGRIKLIGRVNPWDVAKVRSIEDVVVRPYAAPLVHCLIPNMDHTLIAQRTLRRALVYGINRRAILNHLLGGEQRAGNGLISGPFLRGESYDDPLGYAYDTAIEPRPYRPRLAIALAGLAVDMLAAEKAKNANEPASAHDESENESGNDAPNANEDIEDISVGSNAIITRLVLAHPANAVARTACLLIKRQLAPLGIDITLQEMSPGPVEVVPDDVDLLYSELPMWEPVVDAGELLGRWGPSRGSSPFMDLALRQLNVATDWRQVRSKLREIHRIAHNDVAVIPLWQLTDYFAHRQDLSGLGERPVTLYQNVEHWRLEPKIRPSK